MTVSPHPTPVLSVADLSISYRTAGEEARALDRVSFSLGAGDRMALVGESGSGKSTTALAVLGLLPASARVISGSVRLDGQELLGLSERGWSRRRGREVALVPQDAMLSLDPSMRVGKQIAEMLWAHSVGTPDGRDVEVAALLRQAGFAEPHLVSRRYPHELSGGMRQRILIAMAWACDPRLVVADEPTSALDVTVQRTVLDNIDARIAASNSALLLITHDLGVAADRTTRIAVMLRGEIVETGDTQTVLEDPRHPYTRRLLSDNPARAASRRPATRTPEATTEPTTLRATAVRKTFPAAGGPSVAVESVSLEVRRGRTLGIVGESGSGKSTTARLLVGLETCDSGRIELDGAELDLRRTSGRKNARAKIQMVFQDAYGSLDPRRPVWTSIVEPLRAHRLLPRSQRRARASELIESVGLDASLGDRLPRELSGGQRQRIAIARALASEPDVLVCDEAVSALDVTVQAQVLRLLHRLQSDTGVSIVFISHDLAVVAQIADDVIVMRKGSVVESGPISTVFTDPSHPYTQELLAAVPGRWERHSNRDAALPVLTPARKDHS